MFGTQVTHIAVSLQARRRTLPNHIVTPQETDWTKWRKINQ